MIDYSDALTDSEKFVMMMHKYIDEYKNQESLAEEMGISKQVISDWKKHNRRIQIKNRHKIAKKFSLKDTIWIDSFQDTVNFEEQLDNYRIDKDLPPQESSKQKPFELLSQEEKEILHTFQNKEQNISNLKNLKSKSDPFLFEWAKMLKNKNKIIEALELLDIIEGEDRPFRYNYYNELKHLKAILYSHEKVKKWDEAIDILRTLSVTKYHLEEPEITTLLASNKKRKALSSKHFTQKWLIQEEIDMNLLSSAMLLYSEAYESKKEVCYYDAINFAYLYKIAEHIEMDYDDNIELRKEYKKLKKVWKIDNSSWWEVSSNAEFLMLIGDIQGACLEINSFLEREDFLDKIQKFEIETTLRQLELYLHFTNDPNAKKLYTTLKEGWEALTAEHSYHQL